MSGGARPGAGRKLGSISRRHSDIVASAMAEGLTPVEYMLAIMRDDTADEKMRAWAAEKSAPYLHPRPAPIARPIEIELPDTSTVEGMKDALSCIVQAAASGQIAPSEAQSLSALIEAQRKAVETGELLERLEHLEARANEKDGRLVRG